MIALFSWAIGQCVYCNCLFSMLWRHDQKVKTKIEIYWEWKELLWWNKKHFSSFKGFSVATNCLTPESMSRKSYTITYFFEFFRIRGFPNFLGYLFCGTPVNIYLWLWPATWSVGSFLLCRLFYIGNVIGCSFTKVWLDEINTFLGIIIQA